MLSVLVMVSERAMIAAMMRGWRVAGDKLGMERNAAATGGIGDNLCGVYWGWGQNVVPMSFSNYTAC